MATPPLTYPGVYVVEVPSGVHTITGVATSIAAFFGQATKGPLDQPVRVQSMTDFTRSFGNPFPGSDLAQSVKMFFDNGGTDSYVIRLAKGAAPAEVTMNDITGAIAALDVTAVSPGGVGNGIRLEVNYATARPDETFNLTVIQEDAGVEVGRETFLGLSMDPNSAVFAPTLVTQSSGLIQLALNAGTNYNAVSYAGFSQSRAFDAATILADLAALAAPAATPNLTIRVDESQPIDIVLTGIAAATAAADIEASINAQLAAVNPQLKIKVTVPQSGGAAVEALRISSDTADKRSVRITRASDPTKDFATAAKLGVDQGGIEMPRFANFRPAPTGSFNFDAANPLLADSVLDLAELATNGLVSVTIGTEPLINLTIPAGTPWYTDASGGGDGVREKLQAIADQINGAASSIWRAELWGYRLAILRKTSGTGPKPPAGLKLSGLVSAPSNALGGNLGLNARQYSLGVNVAPYEVNAVVGTNGTPYTLPEFQGNPLTRTGLYALDGVDLFNLMVIPGDAGVPAAVQQSLWGPASIYCASRRAFLLIDPPDTWSKNHLPTVQQTSIQSLRSQVVKTNSAVFYPNLIYNAGGVQKTIAPSGAVAGIMARTDATRGVWKAPAGIEADIRGIVDLDVNLTDSQNGTLNPQAVNCSRIFPSGIVNWGARTMDGFDDQGSEWKYIPIRRLALYLEESLFRGTKWVVFEPNDEPLWAKIRMNLRAFMMGLFRQGAFQGSSPDQAFFVKCDGETTTQADRNLGIVNILVGFAPLKPAEFVVLRIQQIAGDL